VAWYADLQPWCTPGNEDDHKLIAVGWLDLEHPYTRGPVDPKFARKLFDLLVDPWFSAYPAGRHPCPFCRLTGGPGGVRFDNVTVGIGVLDLYVPAQGRVYVAPSMIVHYIDAHEYAPPEEFVTAVLSCPRMRSMDYLRALIKNGPRSLIQAATDRGTH
jgi:hypothetical protein